MPAVIPIVIAAIAAGTGIYEKVNQPGAPKPPTPQQLQAQNQLNPTQLANAVRSAKGDVQSQTGGGVSPDYLSQLIQSQYGSSAGNPGVVGQQSASQWSGQSFGTGGGSGQPGGSSFGAGALPFGNASSGGLGSSGLSTPSSSTGFNISDWLQQMQGQAA
jgi:hypothetical protein